MTRSKVKSKFPQEYVLSDRGVSELGRPFDKHIDNQELNALVPSASETGNKLLRLAPDELREANHHLLSCAECSAKVSRYRQLVNGLTDGANSEAPSPGTACPRGEDIDWQEIAAGSWPELKTRQLIAHAALCDHCGPLLRAAVSAKSLTQEAGLLAEAKVLLRSDPASSEVRAHARRWLLVRWLAPAVAVIAIVAVLSTKRLSSPASLSGPKFGEFAVRTHRQHAEGSLALEVRPDSQQTLNEWLRMMLPYSLALPASPPAPGEERPYRLEGARLVQVGGKTAAYIAYQMRTGPVSLMVAPDSVAVASGGVQVHYKKVTFHYSMVGDYKVVTWSQHGLTYAQVSQEGKSTQQSCMVCHSAMRDRDLTQIPTPLVSPGSPIQPVLQ